RDKIGPRPDAPVVDLTQFYANMALGDSDTGAAAVEKSPADLLGNDTEAAPAFPVDFLPEAFRLFSLDVADRMQCPVDFMAIPLFIAAATMIGRHFRMAPKAEDNWSERPCLWGAIVSDPATMKSPALSEALRAVQRIQAELQDEYSKECADFEE